MSKSLYKKNFELEDNERWSISISQKNSLWSVCVCSRIPADGIHKDGDDESSKDGAAQVNGGQHVDPIHRGVKVVRLHAGHVAGVEVILLLHLLRADYLGGAVGRPAHQQVRLVQGQAHVRAGGENLTEGKNRWTGNKRDRIGEYRK